MVFTNTKFIPFKAFIRPHYSTTHTQMLITHYIVEHLHYWTQDVTNRSSAQDYHHSQWYGIPKTTSSLKNQLRIKDYQQLQKTKMLSKSN